MVVISIISVLTAMTSIGTRKFMLKAISAEVNVNARAFDALMTSFRTENDRAFDVNNPADCAVGGPLQGGFWHYCSLVEDFSTNCTKGNSLGFSYSNCEKNRYNIFVIHEAGDPDAWRLDFHLQPNVVGNNLYGADTWL